LGFPCQKNQLIKAIHRVVNIVTENPSDADKKMYENASKTFTVFSPRGGVGTTTVAINLAIGLQKKFQKDVLLIDGKYLFGHVALFCNIHTGNSISDLISHVGALDNQLINQVVVGHASGIFILPSPISISQAQAMKPDDLYNTISQLQEEFPIIVIDSGNFLDDNTVTHMDLSDKILMVLKPDIASIRDARQFMEISESLSYPKDKTLLLLNSFDKKADMKAEEIEKILKTPIFGKIPIDTKFVINCINEGIPVMTKNPRHPISKALETISDSIGEFVNSNES
jgi:pilus assembly protein CpaE